MKMSRKRDRFRPVVKEMEVKTVNKQGSAKTIKGDRLLRARDVDAKLVQDRGSNMVIVGSDVEARWLILCTRL